MEGLRRAVLILFMLFLSFPSFSFAQKKLAFIFGGTETNKELKTTIFDIDFYETARVLLREGYEVHAYFNGETPETIDKWIKPLQKDLRFYWYPANRKAAIAGLKKLKLTSQDKLLVYIMGHGSASENPLQHGVVMNGDDMLKLSDIKPVIDSKDLSAADQIFIDASCFSGLSLSLARSNRCVLSSSHKNTQGYFAFPREFKRAVELSSRFDGDKKSVFDIFTKGRPFMVLSHPMISSFEPKSEVLKALHFLTRFQLTLEEYVYFADKSEFCDLCYLKTHKKFSTQLPEVMKSLSTIEIPLAQFDVAGIQLTAQEFVQAHARLLEIANIDDDKRKGLEGEINSLIRITKALHDKLVRFERTLYNIELSNAYIPEDDACKRMTL